MAETKPIKTPIKTKSKEQIDRENCIKKGGVWDSATKTCRLPNQTNKPTYTTGAGQVTKEEYDKEKQNFNTSLDPALARQQERKQKENVTTAVASGILPDPNQQQVQQTEQKPEGEFVTLGQDLTQTNEYGETTTLPAGSIISKQQALSMGLTPDSPELQQADLFAEGIAIASGSQTGLSSKVLSPVTSFLSKIFKGEQVVTEGGAIAEGVASGSRALGTNPRALGTNPRAVKQIGKSTSSILTAPFKARGIKENILTIGASILAVSGLGSIKGAASNYLLKDMKTLETNVGKLGEQITKIPSTAAYGFSIDDNGITYEYTPKDALADLDAMAQSLNNAEVAVQTASIIEKAYFLTSGKDTTIMVEIEKQRAEIRDARAKVISTIVSPPESLIESQEFFKNLELEGYEVK